MPYTDKEAKNKAWREWRIKNAEYDSLRIRKRKRAIKKWFKNYKSKLECVNCHETHPACLEFHHKNGNKNRNVSSMVGMGYSKKTILKEIEQCEVLCANCHRKVHYPSTDI